MTLSSLPRNAALIMIDVQQGFDRADRMGPRDNPDAETHMLELQSAWLETGRPYVVVQHDSKMDGSVLAPSDPGNALKDFIALDAADLHIRKSVNSAFYGDPDLNGWLRERGIDTIVIAGIQTNMCCETTARMGGNLGYRVVFPLDAMHTFDEKAANGLSLTAAQLSTATAVNLDGGGFASVVTTAEVLASLS